MTVLTATRWPTNAEMIADVAKFGYLDGDVCDVTHGYGVFWNVWRPESLVACDLELAKSPIGTSVDFTALPFATSSFDSVVFDPPYKLNGTSTEYPDERYGVHIKRTWQERLALMSAGLDECSRVSRKYVLLKCMDQVVSGKKRWQTIQFAIQARDLGMELVDRFDMLTTPRPQPEGRRELHARGNYSTLLVFSW